MSLLGEEDWHVDSDSGIRIFQFERPTNLGTYTMLHLVMDVNRNSPPFDRRAPGTRPTESEAAYKNVARQVFCNEPEIVSPESIEQSDLQASLDKIKARRRKYKPDD